MRLIDADKLKKDLTYDICGRPLHGNLKTNYANIWATILAQPTINPVHAAGACYCRECKFQEDCEKQITFDKRDYILEQNVRTHHNLNFCSYSEPKEAGE